MHSAVSAVFWMDIVVSLGNSTTECDCVEPTTVHLLSERGRERERVGEGGVGRRGERGRGKRERGREKEREGMHGAWHQVIFVQQSQKPPARQT